MNEPKLNGHAITGPPLRTHHLAPEDRADVADALDDKILTPGQRANFRAKELRIERGLKTFIEVGEALADIRDERLYREEFATFEGYCKQRWGMAARYARRLIQASDIAQRLATGPDGANWPVLALPATESQTRPLAALPPEEQRAAWEEAVQTTPDGVVTARHVQRIVNRRLGKPDLDAGHTTGIGQEAPRGGTPGAATPGVPAAAGPSNLTTIQMDSSPAETPAAPPSGFANPDGGSFSAAPPIDVRPADTREQELRHETEIALAILRDLKTKFREPDSVEVSRLSGAIWSLEEILQHLSRVEKLQEARA